MKRNDGRKNSKVMTKTNDIIHIEQSPAKDAVRDGIVGQCIEMIVSNKNDTDVPTVTVVSLPAENWYMEKKLQNAILHNEDCHNISLQMIGVEGNQDIAPISQMNRPEFADAHINQHTSHLANCKFIDIFTTPFLAQKAGYIQIDKGHIANKSVKIDQLFNHTKLIDGTEIDGLIRHGFQVVWADYCAEAKIELIEEYVLAMSKLTYSPRINSGDSRIKRRLRSKLRLTYPTLSVQCPD
jgi:hypothetical protein